jgi:hypothetical protein
MNRDAAPASAGAVPDVGGRFVGGGSFVAGAASSQAATHLVDWRILSQPA